jgi:tetratricopeptide (TPR) repeat protein
VAEAAEVVAAEAEAGEANLKSAAGCGWLLACCLPAVAPPVGGGGNLKRGRDERGGGGAGALTALPGRRECFALACRAVSAQMRGRDREAAQLAAPHALRLAELGCGDVGVLSGAAGYLSGVQKDHGRALALLQVALRLQQAEGAGAAGHDAGVAATLMGVGRAQEALGRTAEAAVAYEDAVRALRRAGRPAAQTARTLEAAGLAHYRTGRFKGALNRLEEALAIKEEALAAAEEAAAAAEKRPGGEAEAAEAVEAAAAAARTEAAATLERIADSYYAQGFFEVALEKWLRVLDLRRAGPGRGSGVEAARALNTVRRAPARCDLTHKLTNI